MVGSIRLMSHSGHEEANVIMEMYYLNLVDWIEGQKESIFFFQVFGEQKYGAGVSKSNRLSWRTKLRSTSSKTVVEVENEVKNES